MMHLQFLYKTLADPSRMTLLAHLTHAEYNVGQLARLVGLSEATVSHHVSKLRTAGLLNLRTAGKQHFYRVNDQGLRTLKDLTQRIEELPLAEADRSQPDTDWIAALPGLDDADRKVLKDNAPEGQLLRIPLKRRKLESVLRWLVQAFEPGRQYTEAEVNAVLSGYHDDYATLRRELVDYRCLVRDMNGARYWLADREDWAL